MEKSSFFNSVNEDREYNASDFAEFFNSLVTNGVFPNPSTNLQVIASSNNMTVTVKPGKAWINGYVYINTDNLILNVDVADGVLNRIDRVVLRLDFLNREIKTYVKKGTFASSPTAPVLQRDADCYELGIADIYVTKGAVSIVQGNITDLRLNTSLCGWVNSLIQADTTAIFNQYVDWFNTKKAAYEDWYNNMTTSEQNQIDAMEVQFQSEFNTWFDNIKNTLGSDVAGNLLNQINGLAGTGRTTETVKGNADTLVNLNNTINEHKADYTKHDGVIDDTGSANTYVITLTPAPTAYTSYQTFKFKAKTANTGASTLDVNSLGAKSIVKNGTAALVTGDILVGQMITVIYDGTKFQLIPMNATQYSPTVQDFSTSGTWTKPSWASFVKVVCIGGGGAGGAYAGYAGCGGGGGAYNQAIYRSSDLNVTETVTVGSGGLGVVNSFGGTGGTSSFGSKLYAYGGGSGGCSLNSYGAGGGGTTSSGTTDGMGGGPYTGASLGQSLNASGSTGAGGGNNGNAYGRCAEYGGGGGGFNGGSGGSSLFGGGGGGGFNGVGGVSGSYQFGGGALCNANGANGNTTKAGGGGGGSNSGNPGNGGNGGTHGGGGGGAASGYAGGNGGNGRVIVYVW